MKKIDISTKKHPNTFSLVDDDDFNYLNSVKWGANEGRCGHLYATRCMYKGGKYITIQMHRVIMNTPDGMVVDHIFHNTLDNRKSKMRNCTNAENCKNRVINKNNTSGYKGVYFTHNGLPSPWLAQISCDGDQRCLGYYKTKEDAATAYDVAALELFGEFANLNDIDYTKQVTENIDSREYRNRHDSSPIYLMGLDESDFLAMLKTLTYREREIIKLRYGIGDGYTYTLGEVGKIFKVTRERVRQVEAKATRKLRNRIESHPEFRR